MAQALLQQRTSPAQLLPARRQRQHEAEESPPARLHPGTPLSNRFTLMLIHRHQKACQSNSLRLQDFCQALQVESPRVLKTVGTEAELWQGGKQSWARVNPWQDAGPVQSTGCKDQVSGE